MDRPIRLAVFLSGSGTTLQNLLDRSRDGRLNAQVVMVVCNNPDAYGLVRAAEAGIPTAVVERKDHDSREAFSKAMFDDCREHQADLVCMAGFLQLVTIPDDYAGKVLNIHPALIPAFCGKGFYGRHVHEKVIESGVKVTGCTVHIADNEYDRGPIIVQRPVPVLDGDTPETLAARVFAEECEAYPEAIRLMAEGRVRIHGRRTFIESSARSRKRAHGKAKE
jgi:formyltetrahydrofolate-dependent phosphoribosylglycinamide formyltransferase